MKKALIVSNSSGLITLFLKNDVELLKNKGYEIDCACNTNFPDDNTKEFFADYEINVFHVEFPIRNLDINLIIDSFRTINKILKKQKYDVVHCHSTIAAAIVRICMRKYRLNGTKIVYTSHGFPFYEGNNGKKARLFFAIEKYCSKYTDAIITICKEDYLNAKKMDCKNVFMMHGVGVELERFYGCCINREEYRKKLGFFPEDKIILSVGELNTNKNHRIVIEALSMLNDSNIEYVICGREVTEKGKQRELEEIAKKLHVRVKFLGFRKDIPQICHSVDIGVIPSLKEGLGLSGVEMLASGIPVVGSNRQGIKDYIKDGETGFLADPLDKKSMCNAIEECLKLTDFSIKEKCVLMSQNFGKDQAYRTIKLAYEKLGI